MSQKKELTCGDVATSEIYSIDGTETIKRAAEIMKEADIGFLPVCDDAGDVVGTLTDRDIVTRALAEGMAAETQVENVMTRGVQTCGTREKIHNVLDKLRADRLSRIVCLDENGRLAGVLSLDDLARRQILPQEVLAAEQEIAVART